MTPETVSISRSTAEVAITSLLERRRRLRLDSWPHDPSGSMMDALDAAITDLKRALQSEGK